jgi:hypothetical protein
MAVGLNIVFPVVATRDSLKRLTGIETLGSISLVQSHAWYRGPLLVAASGLGLLVFVYTLILSAAAAGVLRI